MNENYPAGRIYVYCSTDGRKPNIELSQSMLIIIDRPPVEDYRQYDSHLYWCREGQRPEHIGRTLLLFINGIRSDVKASADYDRVTELRDFERDIGEFVTFLGDRNAYRRAIELAGYMYAKKLLIKAHDLAALQAFAKNSRLLRMFREKNWPSKIFMKSEERFAFLALEKIFNEDRQEYSLPSAITAIEASLVFERSINLDYVADYGMVLEELQPVNAVIGANGAGKTRLLLAIAEASRNGFLKVKSEGSYPSTEARIKPSDILSFTYEPSLWLKYRRAGVNIIGLGVGNKEWKKLTSVIQEIAISFNSSFQLRAYVDVIESFVEPNEILIPIENPRIFGSVKNVGGKGYIRLPELCGAPPEDIGVINPARAIIAWSSTHGHYQLSSGQRSLMLLTAQLFLHGERSLVLIDEPENHLHPQYITLLMRTLQSTLIAMESRAVVVTHSPFVVRELDKNAVQILDRDIDSLPCLYQTSLQTFGGDVGQISEYVFGDSQVKKGYQMLIHRTIANSPPEHRIEIARRVSPSLGDDGELYLQKILNDQLDAY